MDFIIFLMLTSSFVFFVGGHSPPPPLLAYPIHFYIGKNYFLNKSFILEKSENLPRRVWRSPSFHYFLSPLKTFFRFRIFFSVSPVACWAHPGKGQVHTHAHAHTHSTVCAPACMRTNCLSPSWIYSLLLLCFSLNRLHLFVRFPFKLRGTSPGRCVQFPPVQYRCGSALDVW